MDEERRIIEREARYNKRLMDFLTCMREDHEPYMGVGNQPVSITANGSAHMGLLHVCKRCKMPYIAGVPVGHGLTGRSHGR